MGEDSEKRGGLFDALFDGLFSGLKDNQTVISIIALLILGSVIGMIAVAIFGWDRGRVLTQMSQIDFARGLITYLFAVVTIGTAVLLIVSALTSPADDTHNARFQRGKEILSLLLGVFGTVVGFYFGSE